MSLVPRKVSPKVLRASFVEEWTNQDARWMAERERCVCTKSVRGLTYLRVTRCAKCNGTLPRLKRAG